MSCPKEWGQQPILIQSKSWYINLILCNIDFESFGEVLKLFMIGTIGFEPLTILLLVMFEIGYKFLHNYADQMQNWGWICSIHYQASRLFTM